MAQTKKCRSQIIDNLRRQLQELESSMRTSPGTVDDVLPSGIDPLNRLLPGGGWRAGTVVEWLADGEGTGAVTLAFLAALPWLDAGQMCVVIDEKEEFYPPFLTALGINLEQVFIVRPSPKDMLWALEQSLRCRGVAVTVAWLGQQPDRILRRLQLATEAGGGLGIFLRPAEVRTAPAWCHVRLLVRALPAGELARGRRARIEVLYCQGGKSDGTVEVEIDEETADVRVAASLAPARDARQAT